MMIMIMIMIIMMIIIIMIEIKRVFRNLVKDAMIYCGFSVALLYLFLPLGGSCVNVYINPSNSPKFYTFKTHSIHHFSLPSTFLTFEQIINNIIRLCVFNITKQDSS